jgi:glycosyltransferase involved in cell wall biosynthesis
MVVLRRLGEPAYEEVNGVRIHRLPVEHHRGGMLHYLREYAAFCLLAAQKVTALHLKQKFRLVQVDNLPDFLVFSAMVPKLSGARTLLYIADNAPELLVDVHGYRPGHPLVRMLSLAQRASAAVADHILAPSRATGRVIAQRGVAADKISVVLNCPDDRIFAQRRPRDRERSPGEFRIVTHGTLTPHYGLLALIDALPLIAAEATGLQVDIYGDGEQRPILEQRARERGVNEHVTFHGYIPHEEIPDRLCAADAAYSGLLSDLFMANKTLESVAMGVPLAISRWSSHLDYFPEDSVSYFEPGDPADIARAFLEIYRDPAGARQRAERAADLFDESYDWEAQRAVYLTVTGRLLAGSDRRQPVSHPAPSYSSAMVPTLHDSSSQRGWARASRTILHVASLERRPLTPDPSPAWGRGEARCT